VTSTGMIHMEFSENQSITQTIQVNTEAGQCYKDIFHIQ
jgi:hypothetical protein